MESEGQAKVNLILELKNRMKTGLTQAKSHLNSTVREMKEKMNQTRGSFSNVERGFSNMKMKGMDALNSLKNEVPMVGSAIRLLTNPITMVAGALIGIGLLFNTTTKAAAEFSGTYRQLQMLNLDKSIADLKTLKNVVKDTAFTKGFDINKTSVAFFDVQSVTGKYGNEVKKIVAKQGEFAQIMQADFNSWIAGTAKAMANYGFGISQMDDFNRSAFATVKTGVTTFDELSRVMSVYSGAAASAKQNFDAANKIFSLFTVKVKSVDEAATLTKSLFTELSKDNVIKAFKKIGISVYDNNGKFKQADSLLIELSRSFQKLGKDDSALIALKNQFTGSEGLTAFIQAAMSSTQQLQDMINTFDVTKLDLSKALAISKEDINYINQQLENKLKILKTEFGEDLLPTKVWWEKKKIDILGELRLFLNPSLGPETHEQKGKQDILDKFDEIINNPGSQTKAQYDQALSEIQLLRTQYQKELEGMGKYDAKRYDYANPYALYENRGALSALNDLDRQLHDYVSKIPENNPFFTDPNAKAVPEEKKPNSNSPLGSSSLNNITGSARQIKNIEIKIGSFIDKLSISNQNTQNMDAKQLEQFFSDMFMRVVRNVETSYQ